MTELAEGTVIMVGVSGGFMNGVGALEFARKTVVGVLFVSCKVLLMWTLFEETKLSTRLSFLRNQLTGWCWSECSNIL